ncbi:DMT family transporter [Candidatus Kuenenbacteria bacterium]|nr:DMT family transporter [Candidatus Kuenenbacteria bacterium]
MNIINFISNLDYTIIAIISALFGAMANVLARVLLKNVKSYNVMGLSFLMVGSTLLMLAPLFYHFNPSWTTIGLLYLIGIIDAAANYFYFKSFEKSEASVASSMLALAPIITFIGAFIFLGTQTSLSKIILAILIMTGIIILSNDFSNFSSGYKKLNEFHKISIFSPIMASIFFGISSIPSKILLSNLSAINAPTLYIFRATIIGMVHSFL